MDVNAIGGLYLKNAAIANSLTGGDSSAANPSSSSFDLMLRAAAKAQAAAPAQTGNHASPVPAVGRPLGAAANSMGHDSEHAKKAASIDRTTKLYEQCRELESFVIKNLLAGMRKTVEKSGLMDGGFAGEMYEDMLYDEYATTLSKTAGFGLADQAYMELSGRRGRA